MGHGRNDLILVVIRIWIRIRQFFNGIFIQIQPAAGYGILEFNVPLDTV